jgi:ADP-ribose pyrophosphatase YjhB (NUDIX family)
MARASQFSPPPFRSKRASRFIGSGLHLAVRWFQRLRRVVWYFSNPETRGVHAVPITSDGRIVLVTLSYEKGWRLPGGGRKTDEPAEVAALRELREEIGMTAHGEVVRVADLRHRTDYKDDRSVLFVVRDVEYRPKWSLEIAAVEAFDPLNLPPGTAQIARRLIAAAAAQLPRPD